MRDAMRDALRCDAMRCDAMRDAMRSSGSRRGRQMMDGCGDDGYDDGCGDDGGPMIKMSKQKTKTKKVTRSEVA